MVRLSILIVLILFLAWVIFPILNTNESDNNRSRLDRKLNTRQSNLRRLNTGLLVLGLILLLIPINWFNENKRVKN